MIETAAELELAKIAESWIGFDPERRVYVISKRKIPGAASIPWSGWTGKGNLGLYRKLIAFRGPGSVIVIDLSLDDRTILAILAHEAAHILDFELDRLKGPSLPSAAPSTADPGDPFPAAPLDPLWKGDQEEADPWDFTEEELEKAFLAFGRSYRSRDQALRDHNRFFVRAACHTWRKASGLIESIRPSEVRFSLPYIGQPWTESSFTSCLRQELKQGGRILDHLQSPEPEQFKEACRRAGLPGREDR